MVTTLTVNPLPIITTDPSSVVVCEDDFNTTLTAAATTSPGVTQFQWQVDDQLGGGFVDILAANPDYSGETSGTLNLIQAFLGFDGYDYVFNHFLASSFFRFPHYSLMSVQITSVPIINLFFLSCNRPNVSNDRL